MKPLPHVLAPHTLSKALPDISDFRVVELRKIAKFWNIADSNKLTGGPLQAAVSRAWSDDNTARTVAASLKEDARTVLAVFRRQGGTVDGEVLRLDLLAREVLKMTEDSTGYGRAWRRWAHNPVEWLAERGALISPRSRDSSYFYSSYGSPADKPFSTYQVHPALAKWIVQAGPPPCPFSPVRGQVEALPSSPPGMTALFLRRLVASLATQLSVKTTRHGEVARPSLKALGKAVPLPEDETFSLPDAQGLAIELLRFAGVMKGEAGRLEIQANRVAPFFEGPAVQQAHSWVRGWLHSRGWLDGAGVRALDASSSVLRERQVLCWYLTTLVREDNPWISLESFLDVVYESHGASRWSSWGVEGWDPDLPDARDREKKSGEERQKAYWLSKEGRWYANALMITLPWLGVVERGRSKKELPWCFRLTPLGQAVFAAPDDAGEPKEPDEPFLIVQPNFDVVAYLDHAGLEAAATLGGFTESDPRKDATAGSVQTVRLTPASVYQALESGMNQLQIITFLQRWARNDLPVNILQSLRDWSARRESIVVHTSVDFLAFPTPKEAGHYLELTGGTLLGERCVQLDRSQLGIASLTRVKIDHAHPLDDRRTWNVDERGVIALSGPADLVQQARLWWIAESTSAGWQLTRDSVVKAVTAGLKPSLIVGWLQQHLAKQMPPILQQALQAWASKPMPAVLADVVLLQLPVPEHFEAVWQSAQFRPYLLGSPGLGWVLVPGEKRKEIKALLEEFGFAVAREIDPTYLEKNG